MKGTLYAVGVGPGDPELLTLKALKTIAAADVIACPSKNNVPGLAYRIAEKAVPDISMKEKLLLDFPMTKDGTEEAHRKDAERISVQLETGKNVAFLTLGDPGFYSTFAYISEYIRKMGYKIGIISGIPSFCAVSAEIQITLASGDESVLITSGEYKDFPGTLIILKAGSRLKELKQEIRTSGKKAYLVENCGMEDERIFPGIHLIPDDTGYFSTLIVK